MEYVKGMKYRVVKSGARLSGMKPIRGGERGWATTLSPGTVLTCDGTSMTFGDGVPVVKWLDADGRWIANDCEFQPTQGGMWNSRPADGYLEPVVP